MMTATVHPLVQFRKEILAENAKNFSLRHLTTNEQQMSGFFDDLLDSAWDAVAGLADAMSEVMTSVVNTIKQIGETIALIVRAAIGDVDWSEVFSSLGHIFQEIGNIMVVVNPLRVWTDILKEAPLTKHAFNELDKFTGGFITNVTNVSDVVWRGMRGDPISKAEILKDIITIIQIVAIVFTGPIGIGIMVGTWVGREVCKNQTHARDACMVAFQILGAAFGSYAGAATGLTWGTTAEALAEGAEMSAAEQAAWLEGDAAYQAWLEQQAEYLALQSSTSFVPHLTAAAEQMLLNRGIDEVTKQAIQVCKNSNVVGNHECEILTQVAANYITAPANIEWPQFLAMEVARIGVSELMDQWFPPESKEARAIKWVIKYHDVVVPYEVASAEPKKFGAGGLLLLAAGGMMLLVGAGS